MRRALCFISLPGSLTAEASVVVPVFLVCMLSLLQFSGLYRGAVRFSAAMAQTAEEVAQAAYASAFEDGGWDAWHEQGGGKDGSAGAASGSGSGDQGEASGEGPSHLGGDILTVAYAQAAVKGKAGANSVIRNANFLLSSFLEKEERIDLVLTYQVTNPIGFISFPGTVFLQKACVRGWTGRGGSEGSGDAAAIDPEHVVYVAANGQVYHRDEHCSHISLSITTATQFALDRKRNEQGEKYKYCELCFDSIEPIVYITRQGDRAHSTLECSGLKRTIREMDLSEAQKTLRPCSRCSKK